MCVCVCVCVCDYIRPADFLTNDNPFKIYEPQDSKILRQK